jgi:hypothetical protein
MLECLLQIECSQYAIRLFFLFAFISPFFLGGEAFADSHYMRVTGIAQNDVLNIRGSPGSQSEIVGAIPPNGRDVKIVGAPEGDWVPIDYYSQRGWVHSRYLRSDMDIGQECLETSEMVETQPIAKSVDLKTGTTKLQSGSLDVEVMVEQGEFRCHSETNEDAIGTCSTRVARLRVSLDDNPLWVPISAYAGLEDPWGGMSAVALGEQRYILLFGVGDGAAAGEICLIINKSQLKGRAQIHYDQVYEVTEYR